VADLVRSSAGFHIVKVLEKRQSAAPASRVTQSHARHILLRATPQMTEAQALQKLAEFKRRVQAGQADFASWPATTRRTPAPSNGGDLGWASPGMFVPEFEEVLNGLAPGQISDPMVSRFGVHLIQLLERRQIHPEPARAARGRAQPAAREEARRSLRPRGRRKCAAAPMSTYREPPQ
jgi:peptidyl-prolyl cis-trans isomerase SurA